MAAAMTLALLDRPLLAGLFAGLGAWTKDEGVLFLGVFLLAMALARREQIWRAAAGVAPGAVLAVIFKFALSPAAPGYLRHSPGDIPRRLADAGRFWQVLAALGREFVSLGSGWYHPV